MYSFWKVKHQIPKYTTHQKKPTPNNQEIKNCIKSFISMKIFAKKVGIFLNVSNAHVHRKCIHPSIRLEVIELPISLHALIELIELLNLDFL